MPTPHKHAALIKQWADDISQQVWYWSEGNCQWVEDIDVEWEPSWHYALGPKPTQPPRKMCSLAGVEFPMPEVEAPRYHYWIAGPGGAVYSYWQGDRLDTQRLEARCIHITREAAEQHSKALLAANQQAIEGAR